MKTKLILFFSLVSFALFGQTIDKNKTVHTKDHYFNTEVIFKDTVRLTDGTDSAAVFIYDHGIYFKAYTAAIDSLLALQSNGTTALKTNIAGSGGGSMVYPGAGIPVSTGSAWSTSITLGTGVATALATPSSANWATAFTDETGNGLIALATNPTFTGLTMADGTNLIFNTTTGTKIGTSTSQKLAFYNSTPIAKPSGDVITALQNLGLISSATITATNASNVYVNLNAASSISAWPIIWCKTTTAGNTTPFIDPNIFVDDASTIWTASLNASSNLTAATVSSGSITNSGDVNTSTVTAGSTTTDDLYINTFVGGTENYLAAADFTDGHLVRAQFSTFASLQKSTPTTGSTVTITTTTSSVVTLNIAPAGTIATLTINFPSAPLENQTLKIATTQTITALTMSGNGKTIQTGANLTTMPAKSAVEYQFQNSTNTWYLQ